MFITIGDNVHFKLGGVGDCLVLFDFRSRLLMYYSLGLFRSYSLLITHAHHDHTCLLGLYG